MLILYPRNESVPRRHLRPTLPVRSALQRLYSMFPNGLPGAGLLLQRIVCSFLIIGGAITTFIERHDAPSLLLQTIVVTAALLLLAGLWTPISGIAIVVVELWMALSRMTGFENGVLLATLGASLALLGPGSHSVDARLYGRKRIRIRNH